METPPATSMSPPPPPPPPPPWEVLVLVAHHLDHKSLAIASCVSKSWSSSMSSDHLWKPILTAHFPSLSNLPASADAATAADAVPYCRLFAMGHSAAKRRRKNPTKPRLSLGDLVFAVSISAAESGSNIVTVARRCGAMLEDPPGVFRFEVDLASTAVVREGAAEVKITWNVILEGWRGVFTMMDCKGRMGFLAGGQGWFSHDLPAPGCCSNASASAMAADLKIGMCGERGGDGKVVMSKVSLGILSVVDWRYVGVEDGLRYLQHFLLTCNTM